MPSVRRSPAEMMSQLDSVKKLAAAVAQAGRDAASKGDTAQARKYFTSLKQCGTALDSPDCLSLVQLVGKAFKKMARYRIGEDSTMTAPNQITGPNAGGPRQFPIRTPLAARVGQFWSFGGFARHENDYPWNACRCTCHRSRVLCSRPPRIQMRTTIEFDVTNRRLLFQGQFGMINAGGGGLLARRRQLPVSKLQRGSGLQRVWVSPVKKAHWRTRNKSFPCYFFDPLAVPRHQLMRRRLSRSVRSCAQARELLDSCNRNLLNPNEASRHSRTAQQTRCRQRRGSACGSAIAVDVFRPGVSDIRGVSFFSRDANEQEPASHPPGNVWLSSVACCRHQENQ